MAQKPKPKRTRAEVTAIARAVNQIIVEQNVNRETACRIVGEQLGLTTFQVRGICIRADKRGWVQVPTRPIHWFTTGELIRLKERMTELIAKGHTKWRAAQIVANEIGCSPSTVLKRWRAKGMALS